MKLMTLDLSGVVGYAYGDPFKPLAPFFGSFKLAGDDATDRCLKLFLWCTEKLEANGITDVVIELPFIPKGGKTSFGANASLIGYTVAAGMAAKSNGATCAGVHQQTWRSQLKLPNQGPKNVLKLPGYEHFAFNANSTEKKSALQVAKRAFVKNHTSEFVQNKGAAPKDDNEADAIAMWYWKQDRLTQRLAEIGTKRDLFDDLQV